MLTLHVSIALMLTYAAAYAEGPRCVDALAAFQPDQVAAVHAAAVEGHSIRIMTKRFGARDRKVVLIGEAGPKKPAVAHASQLLARAFPTLAHGGDGNVAQSWFPKLFQTYAATRRAAEDAALAATGTETIDDSLVDIAARDERVRRFEDEIVADLVARVDAGALNTRFVATVVRSLRLGPDLSYFNYKDVIRRIERREVERSAPRRTLNLEAAYRPTIRHNLAMLFVVTSDKVRAVSGRIQKVLSLIGVAGGLTWLAATQGAGGTALTVAAASLFATQVAIDFGREKMMREFAGVGSRSEHMAVALNSAVAEVEDDTVLLVVPEVQSLGLATWLSKYGFREKAYLPLREDGLVMVLTR